MRNLPQRRDRALDVGCGTGLLLDKLAPQFGEVVGIDPVDLALGLTSTLADPVVGFLKKPWGTDAPKDDAGMPMRDVHESWSELRTTSASMLPASSARRRLFFRYTLRWDEFRSGT